MTGTLDPRIQTLLRRPLALTRAGLWAERLARAFWPLWTICLATLAVLAFGAQDAAPDRWVRIGLGVVAVLMLAALWLGLRQFARPTRAEALARLDATLPGQPISTLGDAQAIGADDPASKAVWQAHLARMASRVEGGARGAARPAARHARPLWIALHGAERAGHGADLRLALARGLGRGAGPGSGFRPHRGAELGGLDPAPALHRQADALPQRRRPRHAGGAGGRAGSAPLLWRGGQALALPDRFGRGVRRGCAGRGGEACACAHRQRAGLRRGAGRAHRDRGAGRTGLAGHGAARHGPDRERQGQPQAAGRRQPEDAVLGRRRLRRDRRGGRSSRSTFRPWIAASASGRRPSRSSP